MCCLKVISLKNLNKSLILALGLVVYSFAAAADISHQSERLNRLFMNNNDKFNIDSSDQSFCYSTSPGQVVGYNIDRPVRIASVSKQILSLWAIDLLGDDYQYQTRFYYKDGHLHIVGDLDPVFSDRKLFYIVNQLNNLGIHNIEKLTFDENLRVYSRAEDYLGHLLDVTPARTSQNLFDFFHTPHWNILARNYSEFISETPSWILDKLNITSDIGELNVSVGKVEFAPQYTSQIDKFGRGYINLSPLITSYLKFLNITSNNFISDEIFNQLGGTKAFDQWISEFINTNFDSPSYRSLGDDFSQIIRFYTGSGLPTQIDGKRVDNFATCELVVDLTRALNQLLEDNYREIWEVMAVPGVDRGTFASRLNSPRMRRTFVAKTGTLFHTSALAGMISNSSDFTEDASEQVYFGIFHQLEGPKGNAQMVQDEMLIALWESVDRPRSFEYKKEFFFPAYAPFIPE